METTITLDGNTYYATMRPGVYTRQFNYCPACQEEIAPGDYCQPCYNTNMAVGIEEILIHRTPQKGSQ